MVSFIEIVVHVFSISSDLNVGFKVLTVVIMKSSFFWDIRTYSLVTCISDFRRVLDWMTGFIARAILRAIQRYR
jgi:hypothetical protein